MSILVRKKRTRRECFMSNKGMSTGAALFLTLCIMAGIGSLDKYFKYSKYIPEYTEIYV